MSRRWLGALALTVVFAVITTMFGLWQWDRRGQKVEQIERVEANYDQDPVSVSQLIDDQGFVPGDTWRPVVVIGEYHVDQALLVRTRPRGGQVGFEVVVPFVSDQGETYLVSRGWLPGGQQQDLPDTIPVAPEGPVTMVGRLLPSEPEIPGRSAPEGQLPTLTVSAASVALGIDLVPGVYLSLVSEDPAVTTGVLATKPELDEGPHLSYTFQWYLFGVLGFVAWGYLLREEYRRRAGIDPASHQRPASPSDADIEDAILDEANTLENVRDARV